MTGTRTDFTNKIIEFALLLFKLLLKGLATEIDPSCFTHPWDTKLKILLRNC